MKGVKICGMRELLNISEVAKLAPDYLGFICWSGSPRYVGEHLTRNELDKAAPGIRRVGVFVNQGDDQIEQWREQLGLDVAQLHGDESPDDCRRLRDKGVFQSIWKAIGVTDDGVDTAQKFAGIVDALLLDSAGSGRGGSGRSFDWSLLAQYSGDTPIILSGGLGVDNLQRALNIEANIAVFDLNSRVESTPGLKDVALVHQALSIIRQSRQITG